MTMGLKYMDVETAMEYVNDLDEANYLFKGMRDFIMYHNYM